MQLLANDELTMRRCRGVYTGLIGFLTVAFIVFNTRTVTDGEDHFEKESKDVTNTIQDYANRPEERKASQVRN